MVNAYELTCKEAKDRKCDAVRDPVFKAGTEACMFSYTATFLHAHF